MKAEGRGQEAEQGGAKSLRAEGNFFWLPFLLQTSDALFPTGAYAHSLGFEESVRLGIVRDEISLREFVEEQVIPALEGLELPYLRFAFDAENLEEICRIDAEIDAWKLARETREASKQIGGRRLKAVRVVSDAAILEEFEDAVHDGNARGHHLVVCALQARVEGVPLNAAQMAYAYQSIAAICGAALKLMRIGQDACQRVLRGGSRRIPESIAASLEVAREDAGCFNPLLEIASMRHEFAQERLFIS